MIISAYGTIDYNGIQIADITISNTTYYNRIKNNYTTTDYEVDYSISPSLLADDLYDNPNLQWVFAVINPQIKDGGLNDWLLTSESLYNYTLNKYDGVSTPEQTHHHVDPSGRRWYNVTANDTNPNVWFNIGDDGETPLYVGTLTPVSNLDYERDLNEETFGTIKIIDPNDIDSFVSDFLNEITKAGNYNG